MLDAVPQACGVRVVVMPQVRQEDLQEAFPGLAVRPRAATLEDGYLEKRRELLGRPSFSAAAGAAAEGFEDDVVIRARGLVRRFGDFVAVDKTSFDVRAGEIFGLLGPNGAGKTTTFKMLCGLIEISEGELVVAGVDVKKYGNLSVRQNLEFFAGAYALFGEPARRRIAEVARDFDLDKDMEREAGTLPGGCRQRLAMAVALLHRPKILFLDEPTSGADIPTRRQFWRWMTALAAAGTTIIVTTHFMEEALYCDRILIQDAGEPLVLGTPAQVRGESGTMNEAFVRIVLEARQDAKNNAAVAQGGKNEAV